jgi:hypothetical protein
MRTVAALVAAATLGLFAADALGQSAPCVDQTDALIAARNRAVAAKVEVYKQYQCVNPQTGLYFDGKAPNLFPGQKPKPLAQCLTEITNGVLNSDAIKAMDAKTAATGNQCQQQSKADAATFAKAHTPDCKVSTDSPTTIWCAKVPAYQACLKAHPWSPGNCQIWNGDPLAACCQLHTWPQQ